MALEMKKNSHKMPFKQKESHLTKNHLIYYQKHGAHEITKLLVQEIKGPWKEENASQVKIVLFHP